MAIYIRDAVKSEIFSPAVMEYMDCFEILWIKSSIESADHFVCCIYHPPKPAYDKAALLLYISAAVDYIQNNFDNSTISIAGDFNQLADSELCTLGFISIVQQPTHRGHCLDRIYTSRPIYSSVKVVRSNINTEHHAIVAVADSCAITDWHKKRTSHVLRKRSPAQTASLMLELQHICWSHVTDYSLSVDVAFNNFYDSAIALLNRHFPERCVTLTSRDPPFVTPYVKLLLREKQKLTKREKVEAANAIASKIQKAITNFNCHSLNSVNGISNTGEMWQKVNEFNGKSRKQQTVEGISASVLNKHYAAISSDLNYQQPNVKSTCLPQAACDWLTPWSVMYALESLKSTSAGLDNLPFWFLKTAAPFIAEPLSHLFKMSLQQMVVPPQWKTAVITPVPKIAQPAAPADFRPISLTPILSRILEKFLVRKEFYPLLTQPSLAPYMQDQFAFRPTGSTTAAIIFLLHTVTEMLKNVPYVHVIALDFSKAFDSLSHVTLTNKLATIKLPDNVYNWMIHYLDNRGHKTRFGGEISSEEKINASVVQGSALGPVSFIINASDLHPICAGNRMAKYADDCYLIVPSTNTHTIQSEMTHITLWASTNNLKLNVQKSQELLICKKNTTQSTLPAAQFGISRVNFLCVLGVTMNQNLSFSLHVDNLISRGNQCLYALKTLKSKGLCGKSLNSVCHATFFSSLTYASQAWWGFTNSDDKVRLQSLINKAIRWQTDGQCGLPDLNAFCARADSKLFQSVLLNPEHVLHQLLPPVKQHHYSLRERPHNRVVPSFTPLSSKTFFARMLSKGMY